MSAIIRKNTHKANKIHYCDDCNKPIMPGDKYRRLFGSAHEGEKPYELKLCGKCTDLEGE